MPLLKIKQMQKIGKKREKIRKKQEKDVKKSGKRGKSERFFHFALLTDRTGYATAPDSFNEEANIFKLHIFGCNNHLFISAHW